MDFKHIQEFFLSQFIHEKFSFSSGESTMGKTTTSETNKNNRFLS